MCGSRGVGRGEGGGVSTTGCLCLHLDTGDTQLTWPGSSPTLCWSPYKPLYITTVHSVNCCSLSNFFVLTVEIASLCNVHCVYCRYSDNLSVSYHGDIIYGGPVVRNDDWSATLNLLFFYFPAEVCGQFANFWYNASH